MWYKAYLNSISAIIKERYPRKLSERDSNPRLFEERKWHGACYCIPSINDTMLVKVLLQLKYAFDPRHTLPVFSSRRSKLICIKSRNLYTQNSLKYTIELGKFMNL